MSYKLRIFRETNKFIFMEYRHGFSTGRFIKENGEYVNIADAIYNSTDAFGFNISEQTKNVADIGSHYISSPERHRLYINGTRFLLQYNTTTKFEDASDSYILKPASGDVMQYRTAERFRYVVGYVISPSGAFAINQALQGDDRVMIGYGDDDLINDRANANGWFWEFDSTHAIDECYLKTYRDGTVVAGGDAPISLIKAYTIWQRIEDRINWYNAGNRECRQTYTLNGDQFNKIVGKTSVDDGKGPSQANFPWVYAVKADATTTGLELDTGSVGVKIFGAVESVFRPKESFITASHTGGGDWEALFAIRRDPNKDNVFINLTDVEILELSADVDCDVLAIAVDPSKTDAGGVGGVDWDHSEIQSERNSALQETTNVTEFPDEDGNLVTSSTGPLGGYQLGVSYYRTAGTGTANRRSRQSQGVRKRSVANGDVVIFLGRLTNGSAVDIEVEYETEQQW